MTWRTVLVVIVIGIDVCLCGCQVTATRSDRLSLWLVESDKAKVYLMGSVHALMREQFPLPIEFEQAFEDSETLVVEVNLNDVSKETMSVELFKYGYYAEGNLADHINQETMTLLSGYLLDTNQQINTYLPMKPWLVSLQVNAQQLLSAGYDPELGLDRYFLRKANRNRRILELESLEQQIQLLSGEADEIQELALRSSLHLVDTFEEELKVLVSAWEQGDVHGLYQAALSSTGQYNGFASSMARLVDDRNLEMAKKIRSYMAQGGNYLVIVGALHLGGEKGIVKLLESDYQLKQLRRKTTALNPIDISNNQ